MRRLGWERRVLFFALLVFGRTGLGQTGGGPAYVPTMTFDVASIRESQPGSSYTSSFRNPLHSSEFSMTNIGMDNLITLAYGVSPDAVAGMPEWARSMKLNVEARSDGAADETLSKLSDEQSWLEKQHMLQILLADRMKLKVHMETREAPMYRLRVGKGGPKMQVAKAEEAAGQEPKERNRCSSQGCELVVERASMKVLANHLRGQLHAPVTDETGLSGDYAFTLRYMPSTATGFDEATAWPALLTALQEQLGLKLESGKGPVQMLAIDHLERPSEN